jgi:hypothetical protein
MLLRRSLLDLLRLRDWKGLQRKWDLHRSVFCMAFALQAKFYGTVFSLADSALQAAEHVVSSSVDVFGVTLPDMSTLAVETAFASAVAGHLNSFTSGVVYPSNVTITSLTSFTTSSSCIYEVGL